MWRAQPKKQCDATSDAEKMRRGPGPGPGPSQNCVPPTRPCRKQTRGPVGPAPIQAPQTPKPEERERQSGPLSPGRLEARARRPPLCLLAGRCPTGPAAFRHVGPRPRPVPEAALWPHAHHDGSVNCFHRFLLRGLHFGNINWLSEKYLLFLRGDSSNFTCMDFFNGTLLARIS